MSKVKLVRWLHLGHRWLGIGLGLMVLLWFISGVVMLFVARPQLTDSEHLAGLPAITSDSVRVSPLAAWQALGLSGWPEAARLNVVGGRPVYHFLAEKHWSAVHADDGSPLSRLTAVQARQIVQPYAGAASISAVFPVDRDQWTIYRHFDVWRPFFRVELDDGRDYYVSTRSGEVALDTAQGERAWNWIGSVVHWLYFTPLRENAGLWRNIVLWASFAALLLALSGLWLGWQRLRLRQPYPAQRITPYREPWKRWHHLLGMIGGLFVLTWLLSGWLSLAPLGLAAGSGATPADQGRLAGGLLTADGLDWVPEITSTTRQIEWLRFAGKALAKLSDADGGQVFVDQAGSQRQQFTLDEISTAAAGLRATATFQSEWLNGPDGRYFPLRHQPRSFPVACLRFADDDQSVFYVAPQSGRIVLFADRHDTAHRWLYQALHRFDFPPLLAQAWRRDALVIVFSLLGGALSLAGCVLGWQRLFRRSRPGTLLG